MNKRYLYWIDRSYFEGARSVLKAAGFKVSGALLTPCQVLHATGREIVYAAPELWSRMCVRQGSWYRDSQRQGLYMLMSAERLPAILDSFLDAELSVSDFEPESLPTAADLMELVSSEEYLEQRPDVWEKPSWFEGPMFKVLFTFNRVWRRGDVFKEHWLGQRANHANFLAKHYTTEIDGEEVPYSVTENKGVCSSCVEFFNVTEPETRKLVRACPGSITFGGAPRDVYIDVQPAR